MTTKADQYRANALHEVGEDYEWGAEGTGGVAGPDEYDCSGFTWAMLNDVGVKKVRTTAEGYRRMGTKIKAPSKVGADFAVLLNADGRAHHIIPFIGKGETVEAKGEAYGVIRSTVEKANARGAVWYRFPGVDLGELTGAKPAPKPRAYPGRPIKRGDRGGSVAWIQRRLIAHGFKLPKWGVDGDFGAETETAVIKFQRAHGLDDDGVVGPKTWPVLASSK